MGMGAYYILRWVWEFIHKMAWECILRYRSKMGMEAYGSVYQPPKLMLTLGKTVLSSSCHERLAVLSRVPGEPSIIPPPPPPPPLPPTTLLSASAGVEVDDD